jgi:hypothetical protein
LFNICSFFSLLFSEQNEVEEEVEEEDLESQKCSRTHFAFIGFAKCCLALPACEVSLDFSTNIYLNCIASNTNLFGQLLNL